MIEKRYLGDGLYAEFDGYQIILSTERETGMKHWVALESSVMHALNQYVQYIREETSKEQTDA